MARIVIRAWLDMICTDCWDFCHEHGRGKWMRLPIVETEIVWHSGTGISGEPVEVAWVDVEKGVIVEAGRR